MTSEIQREALSVLTEVWKLSPDVRLGQLFAHLGFLGEVHLGRGLGYIDDDEMMSILYRHREELLVRLQGVRTESQLVNGPAASALDKSIVLAASSADER